VEGALHTVDGRPVLRFERRLAHSPEKVWRAITEPAALAHWFPAAIEGERQRGAALRFVHPGGEGPTLEGEVTEFDPPRVFAYTWGESLLRLELRPDAEGCILVFTQTFDERHSAASYAVGWQGCLDALELVLDGKPSAQLLPERYAELHEAYVESFGLLEGTVQEAADGWTVRFERLLPHPVDKVWGALSGDDVTVGGEAPLQSTNGFVPAGPVTAIEPPRLLEYAWRSSGEQAGRVRWQLSDGPGGALVALTQTVPAALADRRPTALAAWHTHLEVLAEQLMGRTVCPWPEERTEELKMHYLGLMS
jgi:uncharacterized protein YndB with AHSA1/START domain